MVCQGKGKHLKLQWFLGYVTVDDAKNGRKSARPQWPTQTEPPGRNPAPSNTSYGTRWFSQVSPKLALITSLRKNAVVSRWPPVLEVVGGEPLTEAGEGGLSPLVRIFLTLADKASRFGNGDFAALPAPHYPAPARERM